MKKALISSVSMLALLTLAACGEEEQAAQAPAETAVEEAVNETQEAAGAAGDTVAETAQDMADAASETAQNAAETATELADDVAQAVTDAADNATETATQMVGDAGETVQQAAEDAGAMAGEAGDALGDAAGNLADAANEVAEGAGQVLQDAAEGASDALEGMAGTAQNALAAVGLSGPLSGSRWASPDSDTAFVAFDAGTISGNGGCNNFTGSYEGGEDGALTVGPLASTKMACEAEVMTAETAFLAALGSASAYSVEGDMLMLVDANGATVLSLGRAAAN
ncbi:MAG: META domain-containing protein [Roseitalea sp.]|jgi:heat shock protein HslJ|nr:META domain-containing protein [Roseitalea sp.]MBO6722791.1 META domain-containing protein [Roseitalea sp.]MBO6744015.1 META domain-containing protein [Roseitalea sp.]